MGKNYFRKASFAIGRSYQEVVKPYVAAFPHMFLLCSEQGVSLYVPTPMGLLQEAENFRRAHGNTATEAVEKLLRGDYEHVLVRGGQLNRDVLKFEATRYDELYVKEQFFTSEMSDEDGWFDDDNSDCSDQDSFECTCSGCLDADEEAESHDGETWIPTMHRMYGGEDECIDWKEEKKLWKDIGMNFGKNNIGMKENWTHYNKMLQQINGRLGDLIPGR